jgi:lambda repressor-like predicted transcriptional regulator
MTVADDKALLALQLLIEGNSIRSTERIAGIDRNTIMKLLVLAGEKCERLMGRVIVNVPVGTFRPTRFGASFKRSKDT